jgi:hypothetical protein
VVPPQPHAGRETRRRARARTALVNVLWRSDGRRRLPRERELVDALESCDGRDVWWVCEASSAGPVYLLPTREWIDVLVAWLEQMKAKSVLEVAAGDGFLAECLSRARPRLRVVATDDNSWAKASDRSSVRDRRTCRGVSFAGIRARGAVGAATVERLGAVAAVKRERPDVALVSWAPPGTLVERVLRAPARLVLDISVDGDVCGNGMRTWRFHKELLDGPLEERALCRLDPHPTLERHTRVTAYYGARHPEHGVDRAGDAMWRRK